MLDHRRVMVTGGTGSVGKVLLRRLLSGEFGTPQKVVVFSRDEAKQHALRLEFQSRGATTDELIYHNFERLLQFQVGDVRDYRSVNEALHDIDIVFHVAALKEVPTCEYSPFDAVETNVVGAENIVRAIHRDRLPVETVVGVSSDKACKPVSVMGMTKALQERIFVRANLDRPETRFVCVRYGNVVGSQGSVIPLFRDQVRRGGPVTVTIEGMTRFLMSLHQAVDTIFAALKHAHRGDIYVPRVPSARLIDIAGVLIGDRPIETTMIGARPGEKMHEVLVSEEEAYQTVERNGYYVIMPMLPELRLPHDDAYCLGKEYSSADGVLSKAALAELFARHKLLVDENAATDGEILA